MSGSPIHQLFRRIAPTEAEWRLDERLGERARRGGEKAGRKKRETSDRKGHDANLRLAGSFLKPRSKARGFALVEITVSLSILVVLGLLLLKLSLNVVAPRQWMMRQSLADAFMTSERAAAEKISFDELVGEASPWTPEGEEVEVVMGRLPGLSSEDQPVEGREITGRLTRLRVPDPNNAGEPSSDDSLNPAGMKIWRLQSSLSYEINGREYTKTRTVIRMQ